MSYRDPVYDGATDPVVVRCRESGEWWMFYTQRRASAPGPGVAWVHGTDIGVAVSADNGGSWTYRLGPGDLLGPGPVPHAGHLHPGRAQPLGGT
jgi:hypothetical protein